MQITKKQNHYFYSKCFWPVLIITSIVFSFYLITFFLGNHDFRHLKFGTKPFQGVWEGRLTQFIPQYILFNSQILPILSALIGLIFFCLSPIVITKAWNIHQKTNIIIFSLLITLNPHTLAQAYYVHQITSILLWHLLVALGLYSLLSPTRTFKNYIFSYTLWSISICGYAPAITTIFILTTSSIIIDVLTNNFTLKQIIKKYAPIYLVAFISGLTYFSIIEILKNKQIIQTKMYNVQTLSIKKIIKKITQNYKEPLKVLLFPTPYEAKITNLIITSLMLMYLILAYIKKRLIIIFILSIITLFSAQLTSFISPHDIFYTFRINLFSTPYIIAILFIITNSNKNIIIKNISLICSIILLFSFIKADFNCQKIWHLGNKQDELATDRIRADLLKKIDLDKRYRLYYIGEFHGRKKFANQYSYRLKDNEIFREYYSYEYLICTFFTNGLFIQERYNPIYGSIFFYRGYNASYLINNNEYLNSEEKFSQSNFIHTQPNKTNKEKIYNWLISPNKKTTLVIDDDIFIYLSKNHSHYLTIMHHLGFLK